MRKTVPFLLLLVGFLALIPTAEATDREFNITNIIEDGYISLGGGVYTKFNGSVVLYGANNGAVSYRSYVEWNISDLPNFTISNVYFYYEGVVHKTPCNLTTLTTHPSTGVANNTLFWDIGNGTVIASANSFPIAGVEASIQMNAAGVADLQAALTAGQPWYAIGYRGINEAAGGDNRSYIRSLEGVGLAPLLYVEFVGNYSYTFTGAYYENGNVSAGVTVHYSTPTDSGDFLLDGEETVEFSDEPDVFYWDIGGGYARSIYPVENPENFTVTVPDDTFYVYEFTIKDHTGKTGLGDTYLEAYRTINGTETLIERMKLYLGNAIPLNLVYGKTYHLRVLFADDTRYDWGYFVAGGTTSINLILKAVTFTDQAQILYNHIHVEATRNAAGDTITINYLDDRENTDWANITISVRGGGVAFTATRNNNSYTVNWAGANTTLNYIVVINGEHGDYGVWGRSFILDATQTYPAPPLLEDIFGEVHSDFIPFILCIMSLLTFSVSLHEKGLMATMFIASVFKLINWVSWGNDLLLFGWAISIGVALIARGGSN